jgi:Pyruvate/2-oxoacid:ferredoxin oxidoreductase delta subunit
MHPVYTDTLFWILTLLPIATSGEITTFWPMLQPAPMREFFITCEKCQIFVPGPIAHGSST